MLNQSYYYPQNFMQYQQPAQQPQDERIWVQNETAAEAYLVAPNSFVRLWDSQRPIFYEKRADASGRPYPLEMYKYERIEPNTAQNSNEHINEYMEQLKALEGRIIALEEGVKHGESNTDDTSI